MGDVDKAHLVNWQRSVSEQERGNRDKKDRSPNSPITEVSYCKMAKRNGSVVEERYGVKEDVIDIER